HSSDALISSHLHSFPTRRSSDLVKLKDPRVGFVTVTDVEVTGDLQQAKIFISVLGDDEKKNETLLGLAKAKGFIRTEIGKRIRLDRKSTRLNSSHVSISYAVFCL